MNQPTTLPDKETGQKGARVCVRLPCDLPAEIAFWGSGVEHIKKVLISNISTTGIQILSPSFVATGQTVNASFKVPGHGSTSFRAEVMRVQSLKGKVAGYPYALGAKFISSEEKFEKKISRFIMEKLSCASHRFITAGLTLAAALTELVWSAFFIYLGKPDIQSNPAIKLDPQSSLSWIFNPLFSFGVAALLLTAAVLAFKNRKNFTRFTTVAVFAQAILAITQITFASNWTTNSHLQEALWAGKVAIATMDGIIAVMTIVLISKLRETKKILTAEKISLKPNRPTFTIL